MPDAECLSGLAPRTIIRTPSASRITPITVQNASTGHEGALEHADSLHEPHTADDAQEDTDDQSGSHQVCDGLGVGVSSSNAISST